MRPRSRPGRVRLRINDLASRPHGPRDLNIPELHLRKPIETYKNKHNNTSWEQIRNSAQEPAKVSVDVNDDCERGQGGRVNDAVSWLSDDRPGSRWDRRVGRGSSR